MPHESTIWMIGISIQKLKFWKVIYCSYKIIQNDNGSAYILIKPSGGQL